MNQQTNQTVARIGIGLKFLLGACIIIGLAQMRREYLHTGYDVTTVKNEKKEKKVELTQEQEKSILAGLGKITAEDKKILRTLTFEQIGISKSDQDILWDVLNGKESILDNVNVLVRIMRNTNNEYVKDMIKKMICDTIPEICSHSESQTGRPEGYFSYLNVETTQVGQLTADTRTINGLYEFWRSKCNTETNLKDFHYIPANDLIACLNKHGIHEFLKVRNVGRKTITGLETAINAFNR